MGEIREIADRVLALLDAAPGWAFSVGDICEALQVASEDIEAALRMLESEKRVTSGMRLGERMLGRLGVPFVRYYVRFIENDAA